MMSELINESLELGLGDDTSEPAGCDDITFDLDTPRDGMVLDEPQSLILEYNENKSDVPRIMITEPSSVCLTDESTVTKAIDEHIKNVLSSNDADSEVTSKDESDDEEQNRKEPVPVTYDVDEKGDKHDTNFAESVCDINSTTYVNEKHGLIKSITDELPDNIVDHTDDNEKPGLIKNITDDLPDNIVDYTDDNEKPGLIKNITDDLPDNIVDYTDDNEKPGLIKTIIDDLPDNIVDYTDDNEGNEMVTLDNIIVQDKTGSDSDSEFDFELPTSTATSTSIGPAPDQPVKQTFETNVSSTDKPPVLEATEEVKAQHTTVSQKPVAVIKPTTVTPVSVYTHQASDDVAEDDNVLEAAQAEWEKVTTVQAGYKDTSTGVSGAEPTVVSTVKQMSIYELIQCFKEEDFTSVKGGITSHVERHGLAAFVNFLFGPPKLHRDLTEDRDRVFCIAASQLENNNEIHMRTLQTIYKCLTGSKFDCPRVGGHWEEIGFQGTDPSTDLRGTGLLGLLNLIHLLKDPKKMQLANDIYRLSLHPTQNFPFCIMGINLSRITLQTLREGMLNKECNRRRDVFGVVNDFYSALYLQLYQVWKRQGKTIADSGFVIKEIEVMSKKNPQDVLKNLDDYLNKKTVIKSSAKTEVMGQEDFVNICDDK